MNKCELVSAIAEQTVFSKKDSEAALNSFINIVSKELENNEKVQLAGFGTFEVRKRAARTGRSPQTKEDIQIPASKAPAFKSGKALKDRVNK